MKTLRIFSTLVILLLIGVTSCETDEVSMQNAIESPEDTGMTDTTTETGNLDQFFGAQASRSFFGQVVDESDNGIPGALVKTGDTMVTTDDNGIFSVDNAMVNELFSYLKVSAPGYVTSGKSVRPSQGINRIKVMLLSADVTATIDSGAPEIVELANGTSVSLPGDFIDENGNPYSGTVDVILDYLDPASQDLDALMPGMLYAEDASGDEVYLETYGMISVELRDSNGNEIYIDPESPAVLRFPLNPSLQGVAPATIPLWSFDDELGYWIEDGEALLQGSEYVGEVSHFSFWNCDASFPVVDFCINIQDTAGNALSGTTIHISVPTTPYPRSGVTDENGQVCGKVPEGEVLTIFVNNVCGNPIGTITEGPFTSAANVGPYQFDLSDDSTAQQIVGTLQDCFNNDVTNGYVILEYEGMNFYEPVSNGDFEFNIVSCPSSDSFTFIGINTSTIETSGEISSIFTAPSTSLGAIQTCNAVSEYIEWTVDGTQRFITTPIAANVEDEQLFINSSDPEQELFILIASSIDLGTYTWGFDGGPMQMDLSEILVGQPYNADFSEPVDIIFQLNAVGPVGGYIDITFTGSFTDTSGNIKNIDGSLHVERDF